MNHGFYIRLLMIASIFGVAGVSLGAFGAHFLKDRLAVEELDILKTGVLYLFIHTLALMVVVLLGKSGSSSRMLKSAGLFFVFGITLFSGSLFLIATRFLTGLSPAYFGFLTPVGGLFFIAGWISLFFYAFSLRNIT